MTDIVERIECGLDIPPNLILEEIKSLRQQLDQTIEECAKKLNIQGKQLAECQAREKVRTETLANVGQALAWHCFGECRSYPVATEMLLPADADKLVKETLALPSDSTALDTMLKAAKREALLDVLKLNPDAELVSILSSMAKELE